MATGLRAVVLSGGGKLTAVVPSGLEPGAYDLIVVNPDGSVGVRESALTVTADDPPSINSVEPASLDGNGPQTVRVHGSGFDLEGVVISMQCRTPDGALQEAAGEVLANGITPTSLEATLPGDAFAAGSICILVLTNSDGSFTRYSALSIKTPAQNLAPWSARPAMTESRRALALVAARPTRASRIYAIGGDTGSVDTAKTSVEAASISIFGDMDPWSLQRNSLPTPRTFSAGVVADNFVYLVGGNTGAGATNSVLRAQVLDPLAGPEVVDLDLTVDPESNDGMPAGLWHYRVAATYAADDSVNPGGESMPGEVLVVQLPALQGLSMTLTWGPVDGANGYRVYRTANANDGVDDLVLIAEAAAGQLSFVDGGQEAISEDRPLPPGSLGVWHEVGQLTVAREAAAAIVAPTPAGLRLFVFGGRGADGTYLNSGESASIDGSLVGAFANIGDTLATARAEHRAFLVKHSDLAAVPEGMPWIFVGPGRTAADFTRTVEAAPTNMDGTLGPFVDTDQVNGSYAGYGAGAANGFLFVFGGRGGTPNSAGVSGELCRSENDPGCGRAPAEPPDIRNWNALGVQLLEERVYMGSVQESAFFFIAGGETPNGISATVEGTVQ